mgnify:FL=1|tara:strand:- start:483 stop:2390 length:1908 start_codon:yes stop_codon:yes gene_type:complete
MSEIFVTNLSAYTAPEVLELKSKNWIQYGVDNNYFNYIIDVNNNSTTCRAICTGTSNMIYGKGLAAHDGDKRPEQYAQMMSLFKKSDLRKFISDYKILGMASFQLVYKKGKIKEVHHFPMETLRAEKSSDENGEIEAWYYSNHWDNLKPNEKPERIPSFGFGSGNEAEMYVLKPYEAGKYYYSSPDWSSSMPYAVLENEIGDYLINDCINNFSGTKVVNFNNGVPDPDKMQSIKSDVLSKLTGARGEKVIVAFNNNSESKTTIDDVPLNNAPEHYEYLSNECFKKLIVGHRVTSPMLLGIREGNDGLGNNSDEIRVATQLYDNIVIRVFQDQVIECIDAILSVNEISLDLYFKTLKPIEFSEMDVVSEEIIEEETGYELSLKEIDGQQAYKTKEEAIKKAEEMGCSGFHEMKIEGVVYFMPCKSHDKTSYMSKDDENSILDTLKGEIVSNKWEQVDEREYSEDNVSDKMWANASIEQKKTLFTKLKDEIYAPVNKSSYLDSKNYKIRYKYFQKSYKPNIIGNSSRTFCSDMMRLSRANIVYRIEDIKRASKDGVNQELGHNGEPYNLFKFKGGIYCRHAWKQVLYRLKEDTKPSDFLLDYKKTGTIPTAYKRNPWGSYESGIAPEDMKNRGAYPN